MTALKVVHQEYDYDVPFAVGGRVVGVLHHNRQRRTVTVLVEDEGESPPLPDDEQVTCAGKDGQCSRSVDEQGDLCWQHQ